MAPKTLAAVRLGSTVLAACQSDAIVLSQRLVNLPSPVFDGPEAPYLDGPPPGYPRRYVALQPDGECAALIDDWRPHGRYQGRQIWVEYTRVEKPVPCT